jgi:hypothetical protein
LGGYARDGGVGEVCAVQFPLAKCLHDFFGTLVGPLVPTCS